jgi:cobalt-zinc-cadmium efflux system membrane fusion protein
LKGAGEEAKDEHGHDHDHGHDPVAGHGEPHGEGEAHVDEVRLTSEAIEKNGVRVERAGVRELSEILVVPARVDFDRERVAHVGAGVRGRVTEVKVKVGDRVEARGELLVVESPELGEAQAEYMQRRTGVAVASAAIEPLKVAFERAKGLHEKNEGIALAEVQRREAEYRAAVGAREVAEAALASGANKLRLMGMDGTAIEEMVRGGEVRPVYVVRSPIAGRVVEREVTLGELVSPDREALLVVADTSRVWVLADVPDGRLAGIREGAEARVTFPSMRGETVVGRVSQVSASVDPATRTARVRVEVANDHGRLRPGMFGRAEIATGEGGSGAVVAVADAAVLTVEGGPAVFVPVEGEPNTFARRGVKVGEAVGGMVPILSGLKDGEPYVAGGAFILKAELGKASAAHEH